RLGTAALGMAEALGLDELRAHALTTIGMAKNDLDDRSGIEDMERGLELALQIDSPIASAIVNNLAVQATISGDIPRTDELYAEALRLAERFGDSSSIRFVRANRTWVDYMCGRWSQAASATDVFIAECEAGSPHTNENGVRLTRGQIRAGRGDLDGALADHLRAVELSREKGDLQQLAAALAVCVVTRAERGEHEEASVLVEELAPLVREHGFHPALCWVAPYAERLGATDVIRAAIEEASGPQFPVWREVVMRALDGDFRGAAEMFGETGNPTLEADQRLAAGERFLRKGSASDGLVELERALRFYRSVEASYFVTKAERLKAGAQSESA